MGKKGTQENPIESVDLGVARHLGLPLDAPLIPQVQPTTPASDLLNRAIALPPPARKQEVVVISMTTQTGRVRVAGDLASQLKWSIGEKLHIEQTRLRKRLVGVSGLVVRPAKRGESLDTTLNSDSRIAIHRHHRAHLHLEASEGRVLLVARASTPKTLLIVNAVAIGDFMDEGWFQ